MKAHELYHTGIVVRDINAAMKDLADAVGVRWPVDELPEQRTIVEVWTPKGSIDVPFRAVYSIDGPVRLELVEAVEGTLWNTAGGGEVHHIGYWSDDIEATAAELEGKGFDRVASGGFEGHETLWIYHQRGNGPFVEHVSRTLAPMILGEAQS
jgi:hypothetical protein